MYIEIYNNMNVKDTVAQRFHELCQQRKIQMCIRDRTVPAAMDNISAI